MTEALSELSPRQPAGCVKTAGAAKCFQNPQRSESRRAATPMRACRAMREGSSWTSQPKPRLSQSRARPGRSTLSIRQSENVLQAVALQAPLDLEALPARGSRLPGMRMNVAANSRYGQTGVG